MVALRQSPGSLFHSFILCWANAYFLLSSLHCSLTNAQLRPRVLLSVRWLQNLSLSKLLIPCVVANPRYSVIPFSPARRLQQFVVAQDVRVAAGGEGRRPTNRQRQLQVARRPRRHRRGGAPWRQPQEAVVVVRQQRRRVVGGRGSVDGALQGDDGVPEGEASLGRRRDPGQGEGHRRSLRQPGGGGGSGGGGEGGARGESDGQSEEDRGGRHEEEQQRNMMTGGGGGQRSRRGEGRDGTEHGVKVVGWRSWWDGTRAEGRGVTVMVTAPYLCHYTPPRQCAYGDNNRVTTTVVCERSDIWSAIQTVTEW